MQIQTLLAALEQPPLHIYQGDALAMDSEVTALAYDSRKVIKGALFIAEAGYHTDGRLYIHDAAQRGAIAALGTSLLDETQSLPIPYIAIADTRKALANLSCAFYSYPAQKVCTIGVTGTDGKTTTCNLISTLFEQASKTVGLITTANFKLAGEEWENLLRQSTLEATEVQQFLHRLVEIGGTHAVIEATSHGLELQRIRGCNFDVAVVTNITHEHLDFHKTVDAYRRAKARLFEMLDPTRDKGLGCHPIAILNRDDVSYEILKPYCRTPILDYGIETPLVGRFNVSNCLAAIATAYSQGIALETIAQTLATVKGVAGRMECIDEGQPFNVIVDYAHTPDSLEKVLNTLRPLTPGKLMVVFGSAGERDIQKRPVMGRIAAKMADFFVITDEDPREEDRETILRGIAVGAETAGKHEGIDFLCIADRTQAIATAFSQAKSGDTVLLAGKGHEQSIIMGREKLPWDDRRVAREQLRAKG